jgi:hypothetical protein
MSNSTNMVAAMESALGGVMNDLASFQKACEIGIARRLVEYSPVRSGHFKANWQHGEASNAPTTELPTVDKTGQATLSRLVASIKAAPMGEHVFVNNVPYAMLLEMGHSNQAPAGVVARVQTELTEIVAGALRGEVRSSDFT